MRTTINIDEELLNEAQHLTGIVGRAALVKEGLRALIERESARRLARLGGSEPQLETIPRRRGESRRSAVFHRTAPADGAWNRLR